MSGHSKWATIKHKKGALDAKRGKIFTNLIKEITMAAKSGGDPNMNPRLRTAVAAAKAENMPQDNRNRTVSDIRHLFGKNGGNMGNAGSVAHLFSKKGSILVAKNAAKEDDLMNLVLENGADDLSDEGDTWEIVTEPSVHEAVLEAVKAAGITPEHTELGMVPANYIKLEGQQARTMFRLMEAFEDHDDVQNVYSNADIDEKDMEGDG